MKTTITTISKITLKIIGMAVLCIAMSCSSDAIIEEKENMDALRAPFGTLDHQLLRLKNEVRRYENFEVAILHGYDYNLVYMPNMGDHFVKEELWDDTFNYLEPEILIYIINEEEERELVGVEYLVFTDGPAPEGFIGEDDVWADLGGGLWALHAWVVLENPDGVFHPTNSNVTY